MLKRVALIALVGCSTTAACAPDLRPAFFCAPDVTVPYPESPSNLVTPHIEAVIGVYTSLNGQWNADWQCPPDSGESGTVQVAIETPTTDQMLVVVGADRTQPGFDCGHAGTVLAGGYVTLSGPPLGPISGQLASLQARLGSAGLVVFSFDVSSLPKFSAIEGLLVVEPDLSIRTTVSFALQPKKNSDGTTSQKGYDCGLGFTSRL